MNPVSTFVRTHLTVVVVVLLVVLLVLLPTLGYFWMQG